MESKKSRVLALVVSGSTIIIPSVFYLMASYLLPLIPFFGGLALFIVCLKTTQGQTSFFIKIIIASLLLWVLPIMVAIVCANEIGVV